MACSNWTVSAGKALVTKHAGDGNHQSAGRGAHGGAIWENTPRAMQTLLGPSTVMRAYAVMVVPCVRAPHTGGGRAFVAAKPGCESGCGCGTVPPTIERIGKEVSTRGAGIFDG